MTTIEESSKTRFVRALCAAVLASACGGGDDTPPGPKGPPGQILEFDAAAIQKQCAGTATPCGIRAPDDCVMGCELEGQCSGFATPCNLIPKLSCELQSGCYAFTTCSGSAESCESFYYEETCTGQKGCSWSTQCSGYPTGCEYLSASECKAQPGCQLE